VNVEDAFVAFVDKALVAEDAFVDVLAEDAAAVLLPLFVIAVVVKVVAAFDVDATGAAATLRPETAIVPVVGKSSMLFTFATTEVSNCFLSEFTAFCMAFNSVELPSGLMIADTFTEPASNITVMSPGCTPAMLSAKISTRPSSKAPFCASVSFV
jgi:hypothetical protein